MPTKQTIKHRGQVYTPDYLVTTILDIGGYKNNSILQKHVIDNSCGNGAFLTEIVKRYCNEFLKLNKDIAILKKELQTYIHGIEIQKTGYKECISNLNNIVKQYCIYNIEWDIQNADTLTISEYNHKMDYVFGNPPYVRVHNLENDYTSVKQYLFAGQGMTDLYIVFFEIGFNMLNANGTMCLITPSSWLSSNAGTKLRQYICGKNNLIGVIDLQHFQPFNAMTYTLISCFKNDKIYSNFDYYVFDESTMSINFQDKLSLKDITFNKQFYISKRSDLEVLEQIRSKNNTSKTARVKNGFATLNDKIFVGDFDFKQGTIEVLKASTGIWSKIIFPYDKKGNPLSLTEFQKYSQAYSYMLQHKSKLLKHKDIVNDNYWYLFGRTQAIKDVFANKYAINTIIKDINSIRLEKVGKGKGVYSGLYILTDEDYQTISDLILSKDFINYIRLLKHYKSGGYYTYSSKDLELYINYKLAAKYE